MLLYATTVRLGMLLKKRRMVWSVKCLEPQSKTLFMATVLSCTQPVAGEYGKTENRKMNTSTGVAGGCHYAGIALRPARTR